jgi:hypothetical protein
MALHSEAKKALDTYAEEGWIAPRLEQSHGAGAPKAFAALNAILVACKSAEDREATRSHWGRSPQVSVSGLRSIIARELS